MVGITVTGGKPPPKKRKTRPAVSIDVVKERRGGPRKITPLTPTDDKGLRDVGAKFATTGGPTHSIGGVSLTKEEFEAAKARLGFTGGPGETTEAVEQALAAQREAERAEKGLIPTEEVEALKGEAQIEELTGQVLQPDIGLRYITPGETEGRGIPVGKGYAIVATDEEDTIEQTRKQISNVIVKNMDTNQGFILKTIEAFKHNLATKGAKVSFGTIDAQMQNLEGALVNHKEGAADVIVALQSGGYTPAQAMEDTNNMVQDVNDVEALMKDVYLQAPSVWGEMKGWEYVSRLQKIRRAIIARQAQILNIAETGQPLPDAGAMALALAKLETGGS